jgi:hypothetical protein
MKSQTKIAAAAKLAMRVGYSTDRPQPALRAEVELPTKRRTSAFISGYEFYRRQIRASFWMPMRMPPLQPPKASTSRKPASYPRSASISIDQPGALRPGTIGFWASIPAAAPQVDARFPYPRAAVRPAFLPILPKRLPAVGRPGIGYIRDRFVCALRRLDWGRQYQNYGPA